MDKAKREALLGLADLTRCRVIFKELSSKEHTNMRDLGEKLGMGKGTLSRNLKYMQEAKIIVMETISSNQKNFYIASTEEAKEFGSIIKKYTS